MSCRQGLLFLAFCAWLLLVGVQAVALNRRDTNEQGAELQESESPTPEDITNCTRNKTSTEERSFLEKKQAMVESVRDHMLAKLNLKEAPKNRASNLSLTPAQLAKYQALMQVLQQDDNLQDHDCGAAEETTHFSKHLRLYQPELFVPTEPPDLLHLGKTKAMIS